jgi:hypothetical protein
MWLAVRNHLAGVGVDRTGGRTVLWLLAGMISIGARVEVTQAQSVQRLDFDGVICERRLSLEEIDPAMPADWSDYSYLVMEMRTSSPQRFGLWIYTDDGPRRLEIMPLGQGAWLRASIPLEYFQEMDKSGTDLASTYNRRANTYWMMIWGPQGDLKTVRAIGFAMDYPINNPTIEVRNVHLARKDEGSDFLENRLLRDEFGQWTLASWPRKILSRSQLEQELADEDMALSEPIDFGYDRWGGYAQTHGRASGFFRVEQVDGKWWFIDPDGHLFLSTGINGTGAGFAGRAMRPGARAATGADESEEHRTALRLQSWGMTTGGQGRPTTVFLYWPLDHKTTFLGLPDVYSNDFANGVDQAADRQCTPRKNDPMILGYFVGNEPPWNDRESDVVNMIRAGPDTATKAKLAEFLAEGDTLARRKEFVHAAFKKYLELICAAVRKYDPHHLILGIRFGGSMSDDVIRAASVFDVCSINVYEYEPTRQIEHAYRFSGRPVLIGEFHIGVPENGLGAGLVQAMNQKERGVGYRYYMEQAASLEAFVGAYWFEWQDEPVLGRGDGENYNIGFVDVTNRPYPEMVEAARTTNRRLMDVHTGDILPFNQIPQASEAGTPEGPW